MLISLCPCKIQKLVCRTNAASNEREHEGCISGDLRRNLELEKSIAETKQDNVDGADGASNADLREELTDSSKNHQGSSCEVDNAKDVREIHGDGLDKMQVVQSKGCQAVVWRGQRTGSLEAVNSELEAAKLQLRHCPQPCAFPIRGQLQPSGSRFLLKLLRHIQQLPPQSART